MQLSLVRFSSDHADELVAMWRASFEAAVGVRDPHDIEEQRLNLLSTVVPNNEVVVALMNGVIVGFVAASPKRIDQLYVHRDYQGQGIGSRLLQWAKDNSSEQLSLFTFESNAGAQRFYESRGFKVVARGFETQWQLPDIRYEWNSVRGI